MVPVRLEYCRVLAFRVELPPVGIGVLFCFAVVARTGVVSRGVCSSGSVLSSAAVSR